jgi:N-acetylmuramoyl-L-alanine amidase
MGSMKPKPVTIALKAASLAALKFGFVTALALASGGSAARKNGPPRGVPIDMVVIHSTGGPTCDARTGQPIWVPAGEFETNMREIEAHPTLGIHHMINRDGRLRASVPEHQLAHHVFRYSARSISIELVNDGDGKDPFPEAQLSALVALLQPMLRRHGLTASAIVRHSDLDKAVMPCAPTRPRKVDPGPAFPYEQVLSRVAAGMAGSAGAMGMTGMTGMTGTREPVPPPAAAPPATPRRP